MISANESSKVYLEKHCYIKIMTNIAYFGVKLCGEGNHYDFIYSRKKGPRGQ